jgi:hypothetical protein
VRGVGGERRFSDTPREEVDARAHARIELPLAVAFIAAHPRRAPRQRVAFQSLLGLCVFILPLRRYKRLDDSLSRLNAGMLQYVASLKRSCEDGRELVDMMDGFASADLRHR